MFRNYLTIAFRNLIRHKTYSFINITGLAVGLAFCILTFLFVRNEWTYDSFHEYANTLYRVYVDGKHPNGDRYLSARLRSPIVPLLVENIPEIRHAVRLDMDRETWVTYGDKSFIEELLFADPSFFEMFSFPLRLGNPETVLTDRNAVVLSGNAARKYFGSEDPIGKQIFVRSKIFEHPLLKREPGRKNRVHSFTVRGVAHRIPENSTIRFGILLPYERIPDLFGFGITSGPGPVASNPVYVQIPEHVQVSDVEAKFPPLVEKYLLRPNQERDAMQLRLQPLTDIHLNQDIRGSEPIGDPVHPYVLSGIALLVLLVACINFVTLSIGRSSTRVKEVEVRKVVGAMRIQLAEQFWGESLLLSSLALIVGIALAELLLPMFNSLIRANLTIDYDGFTMAVLIGLVLLVSFFAGSYPAVFLSRLLPVDVLRREFKIGGRNLFGRALVVLQFGLSIFLAISSMLMFEQVEFLKTKNLGFDDEQIVTIPIKDLELAEKARILDVLKNELTRHEGIIEVSGASYLLGGGFAQNSLEHNGKTIKIHSIKVDYDFLDVTGVELIGGRMFSKDSPGGIIVNEAWMKAFEWDSYEGKRIDGMILSDIRYPMVRDPEIIGVVRDFNSQSLHHGLVPLMFSLTSTPDYLYIKMRPDRISATLTLIEDKWHKFASNIPFDFFFLNDHIDRQYRAEERWGRIIGYSSFLAIFVAALGAFGLTALAVARRTKEIGIRKVLGASISNIVSLLSWEFVLLIGFANIIAWPLVYYAMARWLQDFAYRIRIGPETFVLGGALALVIVLLTVASQAVRAAMANPVDALRYE